MFSKTLNPTRLLITVAALGLVLSACGSPATATQPQATSAQVQVTTGATDSQATESGSQSTDNTVTKANLNTATADELLAAVPGLGNRMVREFQEYRPYVSIQQFRREIGKYVDQAQVAEYEKYVYVPIAVNDADADTLQQIPGLDATEAAALIAKRPFASNDAFLTELSQYVSESELTAAKAYLAAS